MSPRRSTTSGKELRGTMQRGGVAWTAPVERALTVNGPGRAGVPVCNGDPLATGSTVRSHQSRRGVYLPWHSSPDDQARGFEDRRITVPESYQAGGSHGEIGG